MPFVRSFLRIGRMKKFLSWWPAHAGIVGIVATSASSYVDKYIAVHPTASAIYVAILFVLAKLTPAPWQAASK